jgi:D-alanyl-D-alanine dipeptidase
VWVILKKEDRLYIPKCLISNPLLQEFKHFCKNKLVQKYSFWGLICLFLIFLTFGGISQPNDNQLFVIKTLRQYRKWLKQNPEKHLVPLELRVTPIYSAVAYQTTQNFTGQVLYRKHSFWVLADASERLNKIQDTLKTMGLSLFFYDTYRPYSVTRKMWKIVPDERYAANPAKGSGHNRGIAVDVTLADLATGKPLAMPTGYDNFSDTAHHDFEGLPEEISKNRVLLKLVMEQYGFKALRTEWWHYSLPDGTKFPVLDLKFRTLKKLKLNDKQ